MNDKEPVSITSGFKGWGRGIVWLLWCSARARSRHEPETQAAVSGRCGLIACSVPTQNRHGGQLTVLRFSLVLTTWSPRDSS